jgi:hypothetical protein
LSINFKQRLKQWLTNCTNLSKIFNFCSVIRNYYYFFFLNSWVYWFRNNGCILRFQCWLVQRSERL